ncbi:MAG: M17 family peptidase N-terminal domain-containing protein [Candidatus Sulfotelmatobacter sp.]|jgi:hypothetical protein
MPRKLFRATLLALLLTSITAVAQSQPTQLEVPSAPIPTHVLVQSPAETKADLQVICLFQSDPANTLHGALLEVNEKLGGLLDQIRKPSSFAGLLGETLLLTPTSSKLSAKRLLIVGLGDSQTFSPQRIELVGSIVYREASRLSMPNPFFAPTILDGGVAKFTTGETAMWFARGFLRAANTEKALLAARASGGIPVQELIYLAGAKHAQDTVDGLAKGYAARD